MLHMMVIFEYNILIYTRFLQIEIDNLLNHMIYELENVQ